MPLRVVSQVDFTTLLQRATHSGPTIMRRHSSLGGISPIEFERRNSMQHEHAGLWVTACDSSANPSTETGSTPVGEGDDRVRRPAGSLRGRAPLRGLGRPAAQVLEDTLHQVRLSAHPPPDTWRRQIPCVIIDCKRRQEIGTLASGEERVAPICLCRLASARTKRPIQTVPCQPWATKTLHRCVTWCSKVG